VSPQRLGKERPTPVLLRGQDFEERREPIIVLLERAVMVVHQGVDGDLGKGQGRHGRKKRRRSERDEVSRAIKAGWRRDLALCRPCGRCECMVME